MRAAENVINGRVQMLSLSSIEKSSDRAIIYGVIGAHNYNQMFLHSSNCRVRPFGTSVTIGPFRFGIIICLLLKTTCLVYYIICGTLQEPLKTKINIAFRRAEFLRNSDIDLSPNGSIFFPNY